MTIKNPLLKSAIDSLIFSHTHQSAILLQQEFVEDNSAENPTCAVDGTSFFFNSTAVEKWTFAQRKGVASHEAWHLDLCHHVRGIGRDARLWNEACDYEINPMVLASGLELPKGALIDARFERKSAEDIYGILFKEKREKEKQNKQGQQGQPGQPGQQGQQGQFDGNFGGIRNPIEPKAQALEKAKIQSQKAQSMARMAGQGSGGEERDAKLAQRTRTDIRTVLARFFDKLTQSDYSYMRPNSAAMQRGLIIPTLRAYSLGTVCLAIDTSGSVSKEEICKMVEVIFDCLATYCEEGVCKPLRVIYCDASVQGDEILESGDTPNPRGGGGTLFAPVFAHLADSIGDASCLVYLTDGENGDAPATLAECAPGYPVLWGLIRDNSSFSPPFGEVFRFDLHS